MALESTSFPFFPAGCQAPWYSRAASEAPLEHRFLPSPESRPFGLTWWHLCPLPSLPRSPCCLCPPHSLAMSFLAEHHHDSPSLLQLITFTARPTGQSPISHLPHYLSSDLPFFLPLRSSIHSFLGLQSSAGMC